MIAPIKNFASKSNLFTCFFSLLFCLIFSLNSLAQGDLLVFPKRIVFDGDKRVEKIILANTGDQTSVYNISFIQYEMNEYGEFIRITEPEQGQYFASPFLRVYPRKVTLAPKESQTVKVLVKDYNKLISGEYRSHLYFRTETNNEPLRHQAQVNETNTISVKLESVFGISIPTIIQKGNHKTTCSISELSYLTDEAFNHYLQFKIFRFGKMSTYGDLTVEYISDDDKIYEVGFAKGVAIYTPGIMRIIKMELQQPKGISFNGGKFRVTYAVNKSNKTIAEATVNL